MSSLFSADLPAVRKCRPPRMRVQPHCGRRQRCEPDNSREELAQPFPAEGLMCKNLDLTKPGLQRRIGEIPGQVRAYKMMSVDFDDQGQLQHWGSGPNFRGGCLTLCTCRHEIRAEKQDPNEWRGWWFAGFANVSGRVWLFYLAQVKVAFESQARIWTALPSEVRQAKSTLLNGLGDLYEPK